MDDQTLHRFHQFAADRPSYSTIQRISRSRGKDIIRLLRHFGKCLHICKEDERLDLLDCKTKL